MAMNRKSRPFTVWKLGTHLRCRSYLTNKRHKCMHKSMISAMFSTVSLAVLVNVVMPQTMLVTVMTCHSLYNKHRLSF